MTITRTEAKAFSAKIDDLDKLEKLLALLTLFKVAIASLASTARTAADEIKSSLGIVDDPSPVVADAPAVQESEGTGVENVAIAASVGETATATLGEPGDPPAAPALPLIGMDGPVVENVPHGDDAEAMPAEAAAA